MLPLSALAGSATVGFSPSSKNVAVGESFNLSVYVNPNGESVDTVRAVISYPPDLLEATNFTLGASWPNSSPGNSIDNSSGIVNQGGFTLSGGVESSAAFGTITFRAKSAGTAAVSLAGGTKLISGGSEAMGSMGSATIIIGSTKTEIIENEAEEEGAVEEKSEKTNTARLELTSSSHPDEEIWYADEEISFEWNAISNAENYYFKFDQDPQTNPVDDDPDRDPDEWISKNEVSKKFEQIRDGVWYFHLVANLGNGRYSNVEHYKVRVDATGPNVIAPYIEEYEFVEGSDIKLFFGTTDNASGIDHYEAAINGKDFIQADSPMDLKNFAPGKYEVLVRAYDQAGNFSEGELRFEVLKWDGTRVFGKYCVLAGTWQICDLLLLTIVVILLIILAFLYWLFTVYLAKKSRKGKRR